MNEILKNVLNSNLNEDNKMKFLINFKYDIP
jgi:hypothetical protein